MFIKVLFKFVTCAARPPLAHVIAARVAEAEFGLARTLPIALAARAHVLVAPLPERKQPSRAGEIRRPAAALASAARPVNQASKTLARAAIRAAYEGTPLTPTGYVVVAGAVAAVGLVALAGALAGGAQLSAPLRQNWTLS
jgi:hypothetical protein